MKSNNMETAKMPERLMTQLMQLMRLGRPRRFSNFTRGEMLLLNYLADRSTPAQPNALRAVMEASSARVAAVLGSLEAKGKVRRSTDPNDRRRIQVSITEEGRAEVMAVRAEISSYFVDILQALGEEDARQAARILDRVIEIAERLEPDNINDGDA